MSFVTNVQNLATRISSEVKALRTLINGNAADNSALTTTAKANLVAAINEVNAKPTGGAESLDTLTDATITTPAAGHVLRYNGDATTPQWVNVLGTSYFEVAGAAATAKSEAIAASQPVDPDLTAIAALSTTTYGRAFLALLDQAGLMALVRTSSEAATGVVELATAAETTTGTDATRAVHPAGLKVELDKKANAAGLGYFATGTDAANLTGTVPSASLPPLAITKVNIVTSQAAMLALTAEEGDIAKRTDTGRTYFLAASPATTLANWVEVTASGDVTSVAGRVGAVTLTKTDVGLANVDNTSDANKPVSTATQTALDAKQPLDGALTSLAGLTYVADRMPYSIGADSFALATLTAFARTLLDDADAVTARGTLDVYSKTEIGNPETDFVATFNAGLL